MLKRLIIQHFWEKFDTKMMTTNQPLTNRKKVFCWTWTSSQIDNFSGSLESAIGAGRWRSLSCPNYCNDEVDPVCGSNGVLYKNDCDRRNRTCGSGMWLFAKYRVGIKHYMLIIYQIGNRSNQRMLIADLITWKKNY